MTAVNLIWGFLRVRCNVDITLLGWPGYRFWFAHLRYILLYGKEDWKRSRSRALKRHAEWVKEGGTLTLCKSFGSRWRLFVHYQEPKKPRQVVDPSV